MIIRFLKSLKNWVDPNYWANRIGEKSGAYDKAQNSKLRQWVDNLEGWHWWAWQLGFMSIVIHITRVGFESTWYDNVALEIK